MTFFRIVLCLAGLLLYLVVRELSSVDTTLPAGPNLLEPMPAPPLTVVTSPVPQWPGQSTAFSEARAGKPLP
jgi:hypothetical protein